MTQARLSTETNRVYEIVRVLDDSSVVLRSDGGDIRVFEESSPLESIEVRCDFCGRWSTDAAPVVAGRWDSWMCFGGLGACPE